MKRKSLSYDAYLKKLNKEIQTHPNYREGMRVDKINANLLEIHIPGIDPKKPSDMEKLKGDIDLQRVVWDSKAVLDKTYSYTEQRVSEKMLPKGTLHRNSKEGRGSAQLQSRLKSLYQAIMDYRREYGSWPSDVASLIKKYKIKDPWDNTEFLNVQYAAPAEGEDNQQVLVEFTRRNLRKFVLFTDGHQETWKI